MEQPLAAPRLIVNDMSIIMYKLISLTKDAVYKEHKIEPMTHK